MSFDNKSIIRKLTKNFDIVIAIPIMLWIFEKNKNKNKEQLNEVKLWAENKIKICTQHLMQ